ncbi:MAG: 2-C-methyl-D-erythritol 4-phosphate cytidylyltransferase [Ruminococcaceae bacterium]|nr:2-C-methyl-D-erythritol 4-phosphate cytidylyltransferase [Oscillospiraceae bacterium]
MADKKTAAVILAAGSGTRMGLSVTKQRLLIAGKSILRRSLEAFDNVGSISSITVVAREDELDFAAEECIGIEKSINIVSGGSTRAESAAKGFFAIPVGSTAVMIHDAARCLITPEEIEDIEKAVYRYGAATASVRIVDSVKRCDKNGFITESIPRDGLRAMATPQAFLCDIYAQALENGSTDSSVTDDNMLVQAIGKPVFCVDTRPTNIKITASSDIALAELIISEREGQPI